MAAGFLPSRVLVARNCFNIVEFPARNPKLHGRVISPARLSSKRFAAVSTGDAIDLVGFLMKDLPHLFDDQGIDRSRYEEQVVFEDPITKYNTLSGYLFNIQMLRFVFDVEFILHAAKQTKPDEITTRWTMNMTFKLLPWKPVLQFTGISVMGINLETRKFRSHVDYWDSVKNNEYFSFEALQDVLEQMRPFKTPDLETPKYTTLKRTKYYEIRKYVPFLVVESTTEGLSGSKGFNSVAGYIFGKNERQEKIKMTTPVFTESESGNDRIQIVLPAQYELSKLPSPNSNEVSLRKVTTTYAAATKFSGATTNDLVNDKEKTLRNSLIKDNLKPMDGCVLARYNDPDRTPPFLRRNEVIIWLEDYNLVI